MPVRTHASVPATVLHPLTLVTRSLLVLAVGLAVLAGGHGSRLATGESAGRGEVSPQIKPVATRTTKVRRTLRIAKNQVGDRYAYGAAGPNRFDCSGLIYFSARRAGFSGVPRTSSAQSRHMQRIKRSAMRPGDFLFFRNGSGVYHVAMYLGRKDGRRRIVHSPGSGQRVKRAAVWTNSWFPGTLRR